MEPNSKSTGYFFHSILDVFCRICGIENFDSHKHSSVLTQLFFLLLLRYIFMLCVSPLLRFNQIIQEYMLYILKVIEAATFEF